MHTYPCNPGATVPAKSNPPCGLERLEELVWLEERPDKQGVSDAQGQQQEEDVRRPPSLLGPLAPRGSTPRLWHRSAREKEATLDSLPAFPSLGRRRNSEQRQGSLMLTLFKVNRLGKETKQSTSRRRRSERQKKKKKDPKMSTRGRDDVRIHVTRRLSYSTDGLIRRRRCASLLFSSFLRLRPLRWSRTVELLVRVTFT